MSIAAGLSMAPVTSSAWGPAAQRRRALSLLLAGLLATNAAAAACAALFGVLGGTRGLGSSLIAAAVVIVFFGVGQGVQVAVADREPTSVLFASLASYVLRVVGLGVLLRFAMPYADAGVVDRTALFATLVVCVLAWLGAEIAAYTRLRIPVYDTEYVPPRDTDGAA